MADEKRGGPHGGLQEAMDYVVERLALASEVDTTAQVTTDETESLFARHLALLAYSQQSNSREEN
ncbi:hypothetical protein K2P56_01940 [Patescibacteria group bacterium]|nr:hypothetical protein [Patescibacteria group bacterium]